jgi:FkbM family methyltransferase
VIFLNSQNTTWIAADPVKENLKYLSKWNWNAKLKVINSAISSKNGIDKIYITNTKTGSSLKKIDIHPSMKHRVNRNYIFPIKKGEIKTVSLKSVIKNKNLPIFLKLDTQGTEFEILKSVQDKIKNKEILGLEIECSLLSKPNHVNATKYHIVQKFMEDNDYELIDFKLIKFKQNFLNKKNNYIPNECDAVFVPRFDIINKMSLNNQILILGFFISYNLKSEAINLINNLDLLNKFLIKKKFYHMLLASLKTE